MKLYFQQEHKKNALHIVEIPEDELSLEGEYLEGEGKQFVINGIATIEGERYHNFEIEFELTQEPSQQTIEEIMNIDWEWYDYRC